MDPGGVEPTIERIASVRAHKFPVDEEDMQTWDSVRTIPALAGRFWLASTR